MTRIHPIKRSSSMPAPITTSTTAWLSALLERTVAQAPEWRLPIGSGRRPFREALHQQLWDSGLLVGSGPDWARRSTTANDAAETENQQAATTQAHRQQLAVLLVEGADLVRRLRPTDASDPQRCHSWVLAALAAAASDPDLSHDWEAAARTPRSPASEPRREPLLEKTQSLLERTAYLQGNPIDGLPLHAALSWHHGRLTLRFLVQRLLSKAPLERAYSRVRSTSDELLYVFIELLSTQLYTEDSRPDPARALEQLRDAGLPGPVRREAMLRLKAPRPARDLFKTLPPPLLPSAVAVLVLSRMVEGSWAAGVREGLSGSLGANGENLLLRSETAAVNLLVAHGTGARQLSGAQAVDPWNSALTQAVDLWGSALRSMGEEIRQTGELGALLARAATGTTLSEEERGRVREQLVDLAKLVPSIALFAAPGGSLLLPLLMKVLPFDLRPSAFQGKPHHGDRRRR